MKASSKGCASSSPRAVSSRCCLEAAALLVRVVELGERVGDLDPADERLPALDEAVLAAVALGERRQLDRVVEDEGRLDQLRLDELREQVVDELAPALLASASEPIAAASSSRLGCAAMSTPGPLADRVAQRDPPPRRREVDRLAVALDRRRAQRPRSATWATSCSRRSRGVPVVGVGLVPLEHRELGVVLAARCPRCGSPCRARRRARCRRRCSA